MPAPVRWVFYRQLSKLAAEDVAYVGSPAYFVDPRTDQTSRAWELDPMAQANLGFCLPRNEQVSNAQKHLVDPSLFDALIAQTHSPMRAWASLISTEYPPLSQRLEQIFREVLKTNRIDAVLTWCNCASVSKVARKFRVPIIHNELGALRAPLFQRTAYFDFQGVNGNTEAAERFQRFKGETKRERMPLLSEEELWSVVGAPDPSGSNPSLGNLPQPSGEFDLGLALQVEDDSNLIAYGNGYSNFELIMTALQYFKADKLLVRQHPNGTLDYGRTAWRGVRFDESASAVEFIRRCNRIATINSSVALESMLLGCPTCVLGNSPFSFMTVRRFDELQKQSSANSRDRLLQLNFALLGYLVPDELLFDLPYYRWRLQFPTELEIYRFHLNYYRSGEAAYENDRKSTHYRHFFGDWTRTLRGALKRSA